MKAYLILNGLINWFKCSYNLYVLRRLVYILKESCFLTICRKHNKNKSWSYAVYSL